MSKKTPAEKPPVTTPGAAETPMPAAAGATPGRDPQHDTVAASAAAPQPECDYRALYEQANDRCLRVRADFDNYRKRMQREAAESRFQATLQVVTEFLRLHDQLSLALDHALSAPDASTIRQGLELTRAEFERILAALGVSRLATAGVPFDPALHEAIAQEPSAVVPAGTVLREWKGGFLLGDRLLRPATVTVSSGAAAADGTGNRK